MAIIVGEETFPANWASALVNGDFSALTLLEADRCRDAMTALLPARVVSISDGASPRFTWNFGLYDPQSGFDGGEVLDYVTHEFVNENDPRMRPVRCDRCEMLMICGVACHERGCPNMGARWDREAQDWVRQRECRECGCTVDEDDPCCSAPYDDEEDFYQGIEERLDALEDGGEVSEPEG